jgi:hypothetical protein
MNPQEIIQLINTLGPLAVELYLKLDAIGQLGPDEQANIKAQIAAGINIDDDTTARIADWRKGAGL